MVEPAIEAPLQILKVANAALNAAAQDSSRPSAGDANFDDSRPKGTDSRQPLMGCGRDDGQLDQRSLRKRIFSAPVAETKQSLPPMATERPDRSLIWP